MVHFLSSEVRQLLHNKFVVVLGDSIQRAVYKDLVLLLQKDSLLTEAQLKDKGELSFEQDRLVAGGKLGELHNGTHYREVRQFLSSSGHHLLRFYFLTRVYSAYVEDILHELEHGPPPDLVIINSCLWDLSRYGGDAIRTYQENLECLFERMEQVLPASCLLVWTLAMPLGERITGGFVLPELQSMTGSLRVDVLEANFYCSMLADGHHFDVLDLHFHFRHAVRHRRLDGIHWDQHAHRHLSQLLLAHVAEAWGVEAPRRSTPLGEWCEEQPSLEYTGQRSKGSSSWRHPAQPSEETLSPWRRRAQTSEETLSPWRRRAHPSEETLSPWRHPAQPYEGTLSPWRHPTQAAGEPHSWNQSSFAAPEWSLLKQPVQGAEGTASWRCSSHRTKRSFSFEPVAQETDRPLTWLEQSQFLPSPQPMPLPVPLPLPSSQTLPQDDSFFSDNAALPGYLPLNYVTFNDPLPPRRRRPRPPPPALDSIRDSRPVPHYRQRHNLVMRRFHRHVPNGPYRRSREGGLSRQWSRPGQRH
ncbi:PC-esterase domain-containing protein 1A isoform X3 [Macrotis lagotis]